MARDENALRKELAAALDAGIPQNLPFRMTQYWVSGEPRDENICQIGVELERAENIWGVHSPPEDWDISEPLPPPVTLT